MLPSLRQPIRRFTPKPIKRARRRIQIILMRRKNARLEAAEVFEAVYRDHEWGGLHTDFYSGSGSEAAYAEPYGALIRQYLSDYAQPRLLDIGCGDFRVAQTFLTPNVDYTGIDVVAALIERNQIHYSADNIRFINVDASKGNLPPADIVTIRQVFQHLSNSQIQSILQSIAHIPLKIITDAYPGKPKLPRRNPDKPHGSDSRLVEGYAVYLDLPPYSLRNVTTALELRTDAGYYIRTLVIDDRLDQDHKFKIR